VAQISKSVAAVHGMRAHLVPPDTRARLSQRELEDRLAYVASLTARAASCGSQVLASCYHQVAKAALTALPPAELAQKTRNLRAKAALMGSGSPADTLRRQADDLEAANPVPPARASVRKGADGPTLTVLLDCDGQIYGVAEAEDIVPALDPGEIVKASSAGMVATHDETGKVKGFVHPDAITPVTTDTTGLGKPRETGPPEALPADGPQVTRPGAVPGREVIKSGQPHMYARHARTGR
jgi:hypothetical protein